MPKIKLGDKPKTFKPMALTFVMPDGSEGAMLVTFKYRTRTEYGQFITEHSKPRDDDDAAKPFMERIVANALAGNVGFMLACVDSWNLDIELTEENLRQLSDEVPAAVSRLADAYAEACMQGRLGN